MATSFSFSQIVLITTVHGSATVWARGTTDTSTCSPCPSPCSPFTSSPLTLSTWSCVSILSVTCPIRRNKQDTWIFKGIWQNLGCIIRAGYGAAAQPCSQFFPVATGGIATLQNMVNYYTLFCIFLSHRGFIFVKLLNVVFHHTHWSLVSLCSQT